MEAIIKSEAALKITGLKLLINELGIINAERFIHCVKNERFDYTEWQRDLWKNQSIDEIHNAATAFYSKKHG